MDGVLGINDIRFGGMVSQVCAAGLRLSRANASGTEASFLDLQSAVSGDAVSARVCYKWDCPFPVFVLVSSIAIILMGKRELIALLNFSSWCLVMVERLFLAVPRGSLQFVIVVFSDHTHLLFWMVVFLALHPVGFLCLELSHLLGHLAMLLVSVLTVLGLICSTVCPL